MYTPGPSARNRPGPHYFRINISYQRYVDPFQVVRNMDESTWTDKPKQYIQIAPSESNDLRDSGFLLRSNIESVSSGDLAFLLKYKSGMGIGLHWARYRHAPTKKEGHKQAYIMYVECDKLQATRVNAFMKKEYPPSRNKSRTCPLGMNFYYCPLVDAFDNPEKNITAIKRMPQRKMW